MYQIHYVICNSGDGSNHIEWYSGIDFSVEDLRKLEDQDLERYSSGDGIQIGSLNFESGSDFTRFIRDNPQLYVESAIEMD